MAIKRRASSSDHRDDDSGQSPKKKKKWCPARNLTQFRRNLQGQRQDHRLCARCRTIDFRAVLALDGKDLGRHGVPVASFTLKGLAQEADCALCEMLETIVMECRIAHRQSRHWNISETVLETLAEGFRCHFHLRAMTKSNFFGRATRCNAPVLEESTPVLVVYDGLASKRGSCIAGDHQIQRGLIEISEHGPDQRPGEQYLCSDSRTSESIKWLKDAICQCQEAHNCVPDRRLEFPWSARVVDCQTRKIVALPRKSSYLALSYVWGDYHSKDLEKGATGYDTASCSDDQLPSQLPTTIEDAVDLTVSLGYQYLWIDQYCIKQYHSIDKKEQLEQMSNIYSWAAATICATGVDDRAGICGASLSIKPFTARSQGLNLQWKQRSLNNHIWQSKWLTRGWTLQELVLSPRCLFFTGDAIFIACRAGIYTEQCTKYRPIAWREKSFVREDFFFDRSDGDTRWYGYRHKTSAPVPSRYEVLRGQYLERTLGYQSDALKAFQPILSTIGAPSYWGIPALPRAARPRPSRLGRLEDTSASTYYRKSGVEYRKSSLEDLELEQLFILHLQWTPDLESDRFLQSRCRGTLPSWTWATQTTRVVQPSWHQSSVLSSSDDFWAILYVGIKNDKIVRLGKLLETASSVIQPRHRSLVLHTVLARWKYVNPDKKDEVWITWTSEKKWKQVLPLHTGRALFDSGSRSRLSAAQAAKDDALHGDDGYAILLHSKPRIREASFKRSSEGGVSEWLLVRRDGPNPSDYRREGLLIWTECWRGVNKEPIDGCHIGTPKSKRLRSIILW